MFLDRKGGLLLLLVFPTVFAGCSLTQTPGGVVTDFYRTYIPHRGGGVPSGQALERLAPYFTSRLYEQLVSAVQYREEFIRLHPEEPARDGDAAVSYKPPFIDGCYFSSVFEGPETSELVDTVRVNSKRWDVRVRFRSEDVIWEDVVVVIKENGVLRIDDIQYSGAGPFNPPGTLSRALVYRAGSR